MTDSRGAHRTLKILIFSAALAFFGFEVYWLSPGVRGQVHRFWWNLRGKAALNSAILTLDDPSEPAILSAAQNFVQAMGPTEVVPVAVGMLESPSEEKRICGARALTMMGSDVAPAIPTIQKQYPQEKSAKVRRELLGVLRSVAPESDEASSLLAAAIKDPDAEFRKEVVMALSRAKRGSKDVIQALLDALKDPVGDVRREAAESIGDLRPKDHAIVQALIVALKDEDAEVRSEAGEALAALGDFAQEAIPSLIKALSDPEPRVGVQARRALVQMSKTSIGPIVELLEKEARVHPNVIIGLGEMGPDAARALPLLERRAKTQPETAKEAETAMAKIRGEATNP